MADSAPRCGGAGLTGSVAGLATGILDVTLAAVTRDSPVLDAAPYTLALTTIAGVGLGLGVAALTAIGRTFARPDSRLAVLPLAAAAAGIAVALNRGLFEGPGIRERSWAPFAEMVFAPLLGIVTLVVVFAIASSATWPARRRAAAAAACVAGFVLFGLADIGAGPFGRLNAYPTLKIEFALLTWVMAFGAWGWTMGTRSPRRAPLVTCACIVIALSIALVSRGSDGIHRMRAKIVGLPMAAASRVVGPIEDVILDGFVSVPDIVIETDDVPDLVSTVDMNRVAALLDEQVPLRRSMNVIWIAIDALRRDHVGCYGYSRPTTPHIDAFARGAVTFRRAITPTPSSALAYFSALNGISGRSSPLEQAKHGSKVELPERFSIAARLGESGRVTMGVTAFSKSTSFRPTFRPLSAGFDHFNSDGHLTALRADQVTERAIALLDKAAGRPFFLFAHYLDPHAPYESRPGHDFGDGPTDAYDSEIAYTDVQIGRLLDEMTRRGLDESTVVVVFSDHGESFGEHNNWRHGGSLYQHQVAIPMLMRVPGLSRRSVDQWATLTDLGPTTLALLGVDDPHPRLGRDLTPLLVGEIEGWADYAYAERPHYGSGNLSSSERGLWSGDLKLLWNVESTTYQVFALDEDPGERANRFDPAVRAHRHLLGKLRAVDRRIDSYWGAGQHHDDGLTDLARALDRAEDSDDPAVSLSAMGRSASPSSTDRASRPAPSTPSTCRGRASAPERRRRSRPR